MLYVINNVTLLFLILCYQDYDRVPEPLDESASDSEEEDLADGDDVPALQEESSDDEEHVEEPCGRFSDQLGNLYTARECAGPRKATQEDDPTRGGHLWQSPC